MNFIRFIPLVYALSGLFFNIIKQTHRQDRDIIGYIDRHNRDDNSGINMNQRPNIENGAQYDLISLMIAIGSVFIPQGVTFKLFNRIFKKSTDETNNMLYDEAKHYFHNTYKLSNPILRNNHIRKWIQKRENDDMKDYRLKET